MRTASLHRPAQAFILLVLPLLAVRSTAETEIRRPAYTARVDTAGMLASLRVGEAEVLRSPLVFGPGVTWSVEKTQETGPEMQVSLRAERGTGTLHYRFEDRRASVALTHHLGGFQSWVVELGADVVAVENLQDNTAAGTEMIRYLEQGEVRAVPVVALARTQRVRLHLKNGAQVLFWHEGWGAPFNFDEIGTLRGFTYRRNLLENDKPMRVSFQVETPPAQPLQPAPAFVPVGEAAANLFYAGEPARLHLRFTDATLDRLKAAKRWRVTARITDWQGRPAGEGTTEVDGAAALREKEAAVTLPVKGRGWFQALLSLAPAEAVHPKMAPSQFRTRFAVVEKSPLFPERPPAAETASLSDYGYCALLGLKCVRESHGMRGFFPEKGKANWQALDGVFEKADREAKRWGVRWFFQANERPDWCSEADYEQIAFDLVSRYKDRCGEWEVENEPNFRMKPEDYVRKCLVPFAKGAKRADAQCRVLGPACVSLPQSLRFMKGIVDADALKHLDAVSTHSYVGPGEPWELYGNARYLARMRELAPGREVWQTEQGYQWGLVPRAQQARYVVRQYLNAAAAGIPNERHYYFYPVHRGFEPWYLVEAVKEGDTGVLEPSAVALRVLNAQTAGLQSGALEQPLFGVYRLRFSGPKGDVVAFWTLDHSVTLSLKGRPLAITEFMGGVRPLPKPGASWSLPLDGYPVYVRVPHGAKLAVTGPALGTNWAAAKRGAQAEASAAVKEHPAAHAVDEVWAGRDPAEGLVQRTWWEDAEPGASAEKPDWLLVRFPQPRTLSRALLLTPLPAIDAVPRDFALQVSDDGQRWKTVASARGTASWATLLEFPPVKTRQARLQITRLNDGWHLEGRWMPIVREDFTRYTSMRTQVLELMLFGP